MKRTLLYLSIIIATVILASSCVSSIIMIGDTFPEKEANSNIDIYENINKLGDKEFTPIAFIHWEEGTEKFAKKKARKLGADAVVITNKVDVVQWMDRGVYRYTILHGVAIKYK